ncbi:MAG: zinc-finger domain-containing protein [Pseudomonadota bacterium]
MRAKLPAVPAHDAPEVEVVTRTRISCDGGALGHPLVWYSIDPSVGWIECGYCGKRFVLDQALAEH